MNTTDTILESIKQRSQAPISQNNFTDDRLLILMMEELRAYVVPHLIKVREDFFLTHEDTAISEDRELYPIAERAVGNAFKALYYVDSGGKEHKLERTTVDSVNRYSGSGTPTHFFLMGDSIRLLPASNKSEGSLRQYFFKAQSELILTQNATKITGISEGASQTTFTVDTPLSGTLTSGDKIDFQNANSPFLLWKSDVEIKTISSSQIIVDNADVRDASGTLRVQEGDYICPRFQTNIPQVPVEYHTLLAQKVTTKILEALGDRRKYELAKVELREMEKNLFGLVKSRVEAQPRKVKGGKILNSLDVGIR